MDVRRISIREAKKRIKNDPELSKMLVHSGWKEISLDLNGDGMADVSFSAEKFGRKIDTIAVDLTGNGEYNLFLHDVDGNGIPDTVLLAEDGVDGRKIVKFGSEVELRFIDLGVKVAKLLMAEEFLNNELGISLADLAAFLKMNAAIMLAEFLKRETAEGIEKVYYFLKAAETYFLATMDGKQPRVRPFGTMLLHDGKLYIQTGKGKKVSDQIGENPLVELCACMDGRWLRISGELVEDDDRGVKEELLESMPSLKALYNPDDGKMQMFYFKDATATFSSFTTEPEVISF